MSDDETSESLSSESSLSDSDYDSGSEDVSDNTETETGTATQPLSGGFSGFGGFVSFGGTEVKPVDSGSESEGEEETVEDGSGDALNIKKGNIKNLFNTPIMMPNFGGGGVIQIPVTSIPKSIAAAKSGPSVKVISSGQTVPPSFGAVSGQTVPPSFGAVSGQTVPPSFGAVSGQTVPPSFGAVSGQTVPPSSPLITNPMAPPPFFGAAPSITYVQKSTSSPKKSVSKTLVWTKETLTELRNDDLKDLCRTLGLTGFSTKKKKEDLVAFVSAHKLTKPVTITIVKSGVEETITFVPQTDNVPPMGSQTTGSTQGNVQSLVSPQSRTQGTYPEGYDEPITIGPSVRSENVPGAIVQSLPTDFEKKSEFKTNVEFQAVSSGLTPQLATNVSNVLNNQVQLGVTYPSDITNLLANVKL